MAYEDFLKPKGVFYGELTKEQYDTLINVGFSHEDIFNIISEKVYIKSLENSALKIKTLCDARTVFTESNMSSDTILESFAFHLLGGYVDKWTVTLDDIDELADDLEPLFYKWVLQQPNLRARWRKR